MLELKDAQITGTKFAICINQGNVHTVLSYTYYSLY